MLTLCLSVCVRLPPSGQKSACAALSEVDVNRILVILSNHLIHVIYILYPQAAVMTQSYHSELLQHSPFVICTELMGWTVFPGANCTFTRNTY